MGKGKICPLIYSIRFYYIQMIKGQNDFSIIIIVLYYCTQRRGEGSHLPNINETFGSGSQLFLLCAEVFRCSGMFICCLNIWTVQNEEYVCDCTLDEAFYFNFFTCLGMIERLTNVAAVGTIPSGEITL